MINFQVTIIFHKTLVKVSVNQHVCNIRPIFSLIDTKFLYFTMNSNIGQSQIYFNQTGANLEGLNFEQIKHFKVLLLPLKEQMEILNFVELKTDHLDKTINKIEQEISLIKKHPASLIDEVVTGKKIINK